MRSHPFLGFMELDTFASCFGNKRSLCFESHDREQTVDSMCVDLLHTFVNIRVCLSRSLGLSSPLVILALVRLHLSCINF